MYIYGVKNARRTAQVHVSPSDSNSKNLTFLPLSFSFWSKNCAIFSCKEPLKYKLLQWLKPYLYPRVKKEQIAARETVSISPSSESFQPHCAAARII